MDSSHIGAGAADHHEIAVEFFARHGTNLVSGLFHRFQSHDMGRDEWALVRKAVVVNMNGRHTGPLELVHPKHRSVGLSKTLFEIDHDRQLNGTPYLAASLQNLIRGNDTNIRLSVH